MKLHLLGGSRPPTQCVVWTILSRDVNPKDVSPVISWWQSGKQAKQAKNPTETDKVAYQPTRGNFVVDKNLEDPTASGLQSVVATLFCDCIFRGHLPLETTAFRSEHRHQVATMDIDTPMGMVPLDPNGGTARTGATYAVCSQVSGSH